jgi:tetratricopeptide (TPR) repeat protein
MLSGRLPFTGATMLEMSSSILKEPAPPLPASVPAGVRAIVDRCLAKRPDSRYQSASELYAALDQRRVARSSRRRWLWSAAATVVLVAGGVYWWQRPSAGSGPRLSSNPEANELFARAMNLQRVQNDIPRAMETLKRALDVDPSFSEARRYYGYEYITMLLNGFTNDIAVVDKAEEEMRRVAQEAPDLPSLPSFQTAVYFVQGRRELVPLDRLERALRENPAQLDNRVWRLILHVWAGENIPAKALARETLKLDPNFGPPRWMLGEILRTEGDIAGAIREQKAVLELAPRNMIAIRNLARAYMDNGQNAEARALLEGKQPIFATNYLWRASWALLLAVEGKHEAAELAMDPETLKFASVVYDERVETAEFYAVLGKTSKAIEWIRLSVANGDKRVDWFRKNPRLAGIQKDPDFLRIVDSLEARRKR